MVAFAVIFGFFAVVIGGCEALAGNSDPTPPAAPDYSTYLPPVPSDDFSVPEDSPDYTDVAPGTVPEDIPDAGTGTGDTGGTDDGGSINLPGDGYVSGPGIHCGLSGCHGHILPHFGFHF